MPRDGGLVAVRPVGLSDAIGEGRAVEIRQEGVGGAGQSRLQLARWGQHAIASVGAEALDKRVAALELANDFTQPDLVGGPGQAHASSAAACRDDEAGLGELAHDLHQMVARDPVFASDFVRGDDALGLCSEPHQGTKPKIGERGKAHDCDGPKAGCGDVVLETILRILIRDAMLLQTKYHFRGRDMHSGEREEAIDRRAAFAADVHQRTGIDEPMIERLVHGFYSRVRADEVLGPIFAERITDWGPHLDRMCAFWSSVTLMSGRYHGRPMPAHAPLPIEAAHFDRWLSLFEATARDLCPSAAAELFVEKARLIAHSLELGIASFRGQMLMPGERLECARRA